MVNKSVTGTKNLIGAIGFLAFSPEPMSLYAIAKILGISKSSAKRILDALVEAGHVIRLDDGRYVVNPDYVYVYDGVAIYKYEKGNYIMIMPEYDSMSDEEIAQKFLEVKKQLPASVRLWIDMEPVRYSTC